MQPSLTGCRGDTRLKYVSQAAPDTSTSRSGTAWLSGGIEGVELRPHVTGPAIPRPTADGKENEMEGF
jgi:hypothetical protein